MWLCCESVNRVIPNIIRMQVCLRYIYHMKWSWQSLPVLKPAESFFTNWNLGRTSAKSFSHCICISFTPLNCSWANDDNTKLNAFPSRNWFAIFYVFKSTYLCISNHSSQWNSFVTNSHMYRKTAAWISMWTGPSYSPGLQHSHHGCSFLYALKARKPKTNPKTHTLLSQSTTSTAVTPPPPNTHTHTHTHAYQL